MHLTWIALSLNSFSASAPRAHDGDVSDDNTPHAHDGDDSGDSNRKAGDDGDGN